MPQKAKILIASDHAGYDLKSFLIEKLQEKYQIQDLGCDSAQKSVDYPDFAQKAIEKINDDRAILICGSGIGISIAANRHKHIRAALCTSENMAKLSRQHNDANVICLGARITPQDDALKAVETFLNTDFQGARHEARIKKIS